MADDTKGWIDDWTGDVHAGDAFDVLPELPDESVHACITDPPYGLAFMGRDWDDFEPREYQDWAEEWSREVKRVLKPGGHLLAFSGNRTHHRLFTGVEDAGFEIRDTLTWHYGSGFPKASDVSKTIDKRRDDEEVREVTEWLRERIDESDTTDDDLSSAVGVTKSQVTSHWAAEPRHTQPQVPSWGYWGRLKELVGFDDEMDDAVRYLLEKGTPGDGDHQRDITGQHAEPASEIYRNELDDDVPLTAPATDAAKEWDGWKTGLKPATEFVVMARKPYDGATVDSVLENGTGALNIDACRIDSGERPDRGGENHGSESVFGQVQGSNYATGTTTEGRYPANAVFDETAADALDREVGELAGESRDEVTSSDGRIFDTGSNNCYQQDPGGPSRYFYTSKASRAERTHGGDIDNDHPTVKPVDLMKWLVRLVTREDQVVLDPFAGSGTTAVAAKDLGREFVAIERQAKYVSLAQARIGIDVDDPSVIRDDVETGLDAFAGGE